MIKKIIAKLNGFAAAILDADVCTEEMVDFWAERIEGLFPKWISVDDKLPPYNEKVLVFYGIDRYIGIASLVDVVASQMFWYDGRKSVYHITHWMPLPAFPKKGGNNAR